MLPLSLPTFANSSSRSCTSTRRKSFSVERPALRREMCAVAGAISVRCKGFLSAVRVLPFRAPVIDYAGIAAVEGEPGAFLGDNLVNAPAEERFLDLSGWRTRRAGRPQGDGRQQIPIQTRGAVGDAVRLRRSHGTADFGTTSSCSTTFGCGGCCRPCERRTSSKCSTALGMTQPCSAITSSSRREEDRSRAAPISRPWSSEASQEIGCVLRCCSRRC